MCSTCLTKQECQCHCQTLYLKEQQQQQQMLVARSGNKIRTRGERGKEEEER